MKHWSVVKNGWSAFIVAGVLLNPTYGIAEMPQLKPGVAPQNMKNSNLPQTLPKPNAQLKKPKPVCADVAAVGLRVANVRKNANGTFDFNLMGSLQNRGPGNYSSGPNQQMVRTMRVDPTGRETQMSKWDLTELAAGAGRNYYSASVKGWNLSTEFLPSFYFGVSYGPDIAMDSNPNNDDCNAGNNYARISWQAINDHLHRYSGR